MEVMANQSIQDIEALQKEWILCYRRRTQISPNIKVSNPPKQHDCFDEEKERVSVPWWMTSKNIWTGYVLWIVGNSNLTKHAKKSNYSSHLTLTSDSKSSVCKGSSVPRSRSSTACIQPPTEAIRSKIAVIHQVRRLNSKSRRPFGGAR